MSTPTTVRFLITVPSRNGSSETRQFLLNLQLSLEAASEEDCVEHVTVALVAQSEVSSPETLPEGSVPTSDSSGPLMDNPNPGG